MMDNKITMYSGDDLKYCVPYIDERIIYVGFSDSSGEEDSDSEGETFEIDYSLASRRAKDKYARLKKEEMRRVPYEVADNLRVGTLVLTGEGLHEWTGVRVDYKGEIVIVDRRELWFRGGVYTTTANSGRYELIRYHCDARYGVLHDDYGATYHYNEHIDSDGVAYLMVKGAYQQIRVSTIIDARALDPWCSGQLDFADMNICVHQHLYSCPVGWDYGEHNDYMVIIGNQEFIWSKRYTTVLPVMGVADGYAQTTLGSCCVGEDIMRGDNIEVYNDSLEVIRICQPDEQPYYYGTDIIYLDATYCINVIRQSNAYYLWSNVGHFFARYGTNYIDEIDEEDCVSMSVMCVICCDAVSTISIVENTVIGRCSAHLNEAICDNVLHHNHDTSGRYICSTLQSVRGYREHVCYQYEIRGLTMHLVYEGPVYGCSAVVGQRGHKAIVINCDEAIKRTAVYNTVVCYCLEDDRQYGQSVTGDDDIKLAAAVGGMPVEQAIISQGLSSFVTENSNIDDAVLVYDILRDNPGLSCTQVQKRMKKIKMHSGKCSAIIAWLFEKNEIRFVAASGFKQWFIV